MFGHKANTTLAANKPGVWQLIAHPDMENEWNKTNTLEDKLLNARRAAEEIAAWRRMVKAR